jgi:hypothetical protein
MTAPKGKVIVGHPEAPRSISNRRVNGVRMARMSPHDMRIKTAGNRS